MKFTQHYMRAEVRALLPQVRAWLTQLQELRHKQDKLEERLAGLLAPGADLGGSLVNQSVRTLGAMQTLLMEFVRREIQIKDLERGLLDFPAIVDGKEVFLCWEQSEEDVEFWHDLDSGYAGREPL